MSDYLSNLAARTLNLSKVVRPRLLSRFEPSAHAGSLIAYSPRHHGKATEQTSETTLTGNFFERDLDASTRGSSFEDSTETEGGAREGREDNTSLLSHHPTERTEGGRTATHLSRKTPPGESAFFNPTKETASDSSSHKAASQIEKPVQVNIVSPKKDDASPRAEEKNALLRQSGGQSLKDRDEGFEVGQSGPGEMRKRAHSSTAETPARETLFRPTAFVTPRSITPRAVSSSRPNKEQTETSDAAPHIRVTIGRVEVRAVMPAAPPAARPARAAPASPSLEDYLRKGERGER